MLSDYGVLSASFIKKSLFKTTQTVSRECSFRDSWVRKMGVSGQPRPREPIARVTVNIFTGDDRINLT